MCPFQSGNPEVGWIRIVAALCQDQVIETRNKKSGAHYGCSMQCISHSNAGWWTAPWCFNFHVVLSIHLKNISQLQESGAYPQQQASSIFWQSFTLQEAFPSTNRSKPRGFLKFRCFCAFGNFSAGINRKTSTPVVSSALQREVANVSVASILGPLNPLLHPAITSLVRGVFSFALAIPTW